VRVPGDAFRSPTRDIVTAKKRARTSDCPKRLTDPILGTLRLSAALDGTDEYQTKLMLAGRRVTIDLYTDGNGSLKPCIARARRIVESYPSIEQAMHRYIERQIFPTFNEKWRPNGKPFTLEQVLRHLKLRAITTHPRPEATFWFTAGNLFLGHILQLRMAERDKIVGHDMAG
jgi:hypothetical protein